MFLRRNIEIEHFSNEYENLISETVSLYKKYKEFNLKTGKHIKTLKSEFKSPYQILYFLVRKHKPQIIVETGVAAGKSSGFILQAIHDNKKGKLYSIDLPFQWYIYGNSTLHLDSLPAGKLSGYLVPDDLKKNWKLIIGDTYIELPKLLKKLGNVDLFFHDSEHTYKTMMFEYDSAWAILKEKGFLISDDINFTKAFDHFAKKQTSESFKFDQLGIIIK